jgi:hypothetical protein
MVVKMNLCNLGCGREGTIAYTSYYKRGLFRCTQHRTQCPGQTEKLKEASKKAMAKIDRDASVQKRKNTLAKTDDTGLSGFRKNSRSTDGTS